MRKEKGKKQMSIRQLRHLLPLGLLALTACIGDPAGTIHYHRWGVVREQPIRCIQTVDDRGVPYVISSADFENREELREGDCCAVDFKTNFVETLADGVYKAEIFQYDTVAVWPVRESLTDTTAFLPDERFVTVDFGRSLYIAGRLFVQTQHTDHQADQQDLFDLSYDPGQVVEVDTAGHRIYNLFLRVRSLPGTGDSTKWIKASAFKIDDFLRKVRPAEEAQGESTIRFCLNYPLRYNSDTTAYLWGKTDPFALQFTE